MAHFLRQGLNLLRLRCLWWMGEQSVVAKSCYAFHCFAPFNVPWAGMRAGNVK